MNKTEWEQVGVIGVDAGLCWVGDPCYIIHSEPNKDLGKDWLDFCDRLCDGEISGTKQWNCNLGQPGLGVTVSTGYGDGEYPVFVKRNSEGRIAEVKVKFI